MGELEGGLTLAEALQPTKYPTLEMGRRRGKEKPIEPLGPKKVSFCVKRRNV